MSEIPIYGEGLPEAICGAFAELPAGMYEVTEPFDSPFHDGRVKYGTKSYKGFSKGARFLLEKQTSSEDIGGHAFLVTQYTVRFSSRVLVSFHSWGGKGVVTYSHSLPGSVAPSQRKELRFLELFMECTSPLEKSTVGSVLGGEVTHCNPPLEGILAVLVESGKVSLQDLRDALRDWDQLGQEEADDLYVRHGLGHLV